MPNPTSDLQPSPTAPNALGGGMLARAGLLGCVAVVGLGAIALGSGALPEGTAPFVGSGACAALVAAGLALLLHGRFLDRKATASLRGDARLVAGRLQSLLAAAFGIKLLMLAAAVLALHGYGVKFQQLAAFAVAFAAASLVCQVVAAGSLARALARGNASRGAVPERSGVPGGAP